jgi:hypothetical protein
MSDLVKHNIWLSKVHEELTTPPLQHETVVQYTWKPALGTDKYSIFILKNLENNKFRAFKKYWDTTHLPDNPILYNLDNTGVKTKELEITKDKLLKVIDHITSISNYPLSVNNEDSIILDGVEETLKIKYKGVNKNYTWNSKTKDLETIQPIIDSVLLLSKN